MYQCIIPPRIFLAVGVGLLIVSLVLGWISFSVPDWLQFHERISSKNLTTIENNLDDDTRIEFKKFGLWYKCTFSTETNDFLCLLWNKDAPSFVRVAQVLIPFGLSLGCLSLLAAVIGFMSRRTFITAVLFSALFAFLSFIFTTIGMTVFATESIVYVERLRLNNNDNPRRWGMWLITPNIVLSFLASLCFIFASIFNWCDYRSMQVTGILSHSVDKYAGSVFKAPSESNMTSGLKKQQQQYLHPQHLPGHDYPNTCYQINGTNNNNQNPLGYPPPPSYGAPIQQNGSNGAYNPTFQNSAGLFAYSRPSSPIYPHSNSDPYHHRHLMTESSEMDELPHMSRSRRRSRHRSSYRSRSHSPRDNTSGKINSQEHNNTKQPQFIPIPVPYYQPQMQAPTQQSTQPIIQTPHTPSNNPSNNNNNNNNTNKQPMTYVIQQPLKQQFVEEIIQSAPKATNMLTYGSGQPSLVVSNPTQPVYTIAYRANNGGSVLSNILTGPAASTYVTATRNQFAANHSPPCDSDNSVKDYRVLPRRHHSKKLNTNEAWTWRKL
ncbi:unnamed protein product [Adineta steineri]|uniref:Uncharacterized protein n=1 Tax=Adineta steineri TaxID=433720 RepID=A0A814P0Z4_9BILA|nr:unnamed protein product [Adineta steineri]CAF1099253.1 unnamed protein product [Adineta steineri]CAF1104183.1 unnamed protein product [Adineta steineri]CAF3598664.1 unnamed protein product [Adineta steineri]CAF3693121.1 unnamed protein product [Adineta steineri]